MSKSTCQQCGAPRKLLDKECPYCGCAYDDSFDEEEVHQATLAQQGILFESEAAKRWSFWAHTKCRLRIAQDCLTFDDFADETYSFTIPMDELKRAKIERPRGWLGSSDDMLIILADGTEYEIGLEPGVKQKALDILQALWEGR